MTRICTKKLENTMNKEIRPIDIINFKKVSEYLTGKSFNLRSDRDFGKHKSNVDELIEAVEFWMSDIVEEVEKPKWKQDAEKKSNPADYDSVKEAREIKSMLSDESGQFPSKVTSEKSQNLKNFEKLVSNETSTFMKDFVEEKKTKKVDMDALRKIASGEGLKGEFQLTKKKANIDEEYEFEYVKSVPGINDAIYLDKKGLACYDKDDLGVFYVKWEAKYMRFEDKAEFDRFAKEYLTLI